MAYPIAAPSSRGGRPPPARACSGCPSSSSRFAQTRSASSRRSTESSMTRNSSPAKRATRSLARTAAARRCASSCSTASPMSWPNSSLTRLKWLMSMNRTTKGRGSPRRRCCTMRSSTQRISASRFASPVNGSVSRRLCISEKLRARSPSSSLRVDSASAPVLPWPTPRAAAASWRNSFVTVDSTSMPVSITTTAANAASSTVRRKLSMMPCRKSCRGTATMMSQSSPASSVSRA